MTVVLRVDSVNFEGCQNAIFKLQRTLFRTDKIGQLEGPERILRERDRVGALVLLVLWRQRSSRCPRPEEIHDDHRRRRRVGRALS